MSGSIKVAESDFIVEEIMGYDFSGDGDHTVLQIRKRGLNTMDVVDAISRVSGVAQRHIGFCGLKDRHALTTQWFSVALPPRASPHWARLESDRLELLATDRHRRKLKRGAHWGNRFEVVISDIKGDIPALEAGLARARTAGVPNTFGPQRFGAENLRKADEFVRGRASGVSRFERGMLLSAMRSHMFNEVLCLRFRQGTWNALIDGDVASLDGSRSFFRVEPDDPSLAERLARMDVHPSGPLFGRGENPATGKVGELERSVFERYPHWCDGLMRHGLSMQRRSLRMPVPGLAWRMQEPCAVRLAFELRKGGFATALVDHLVKTGGGHRPRQLE